MSISSRINISNTPAIKSGLERNIFTRTKQPPSNDRKTEMALGKETERQKIFDSAIIEIARQIKSPEIPFSFEIDGIKVFIDQGCLSFSNKIVKPITKDESGYPKYLTLKCAYFRNIHPEISLEKDINRLERLILDRKNQKLFRERVFIAYGGRCAISRATINAGLEAAHIRPFFQSGDDDLSNGLLLRSDLHALFDAGLISVNPENFTIELSSAVSADPVYVVYSQKILRPRELGFGEPSREALREHYDNFLTIHR